MEIFLSIFASVWLTASFMNLGILSATKMLTKEADMLKERTHLGMFFSYALMGPFALGALIALILDDSE